MAGNQYQFYPWLASIFKGLNAWRTAIHRGPLEPPGGLLNLAAGRA